MPAPSFCLLNDVLQGPAILLWEYSLVTLFSMRGTNRRLWFLNDHGLLYPVTQLPSTKYSHDQVTPPQGSHASSRAAYLPAMA